MDRGKTIRNYSALIGVFQKQRLRGCSDDRTFVRGGCLCRGGEGGQIGRREMLNCDAD